MYATQRRGLADFFIHTHVLCKPGQLSYQGHKADSACMNHSSIQLNTEVGYRYQKVQDQRKSSALVLRLPLSCSLSPSNRKGEPHIVHHTLTHPQPTHLPTHTHRQRDLNDRSQMGNLKLWTAETVTVQQVYRLATHRTW